MNKNAKIIFYHNLLHVIQSLRFSAIIYQGTIGLSRPGLETAQSEHYILITVYNPGRLRPTKYCWCKCVYGHIDK